MSTVSGGRPAFSLRNKLMIMGALLTVLPLGAVGLALVDINADALEHTTREFQLAITNDVSRAVEGTFERVQDTLDAVARTLTDADLPGQARVGNALRLVASAAAVDHVTLYGPEGQLLDTIREAAASTVQPLQTLPEALRAQAADPKQNVATGRAVLVDGGVRVPLVVPLRAEGKLTGYAGTLMSVGPVQDRLERLIALHFEGLPDPLWIIDDQERLIAGPTGSAPLGPAPKLPLLELAAPEGGQMLVSQVYEQGDGETMVGALVPLTGRPWRVILQQPQAVIYHSLRQMRLIIISTIIGAILIALVGALMLARRITAPLDRLSKFAAALSQRRFSERVTVDTRDELSLLGQALSNAAADLEASEARIQREVAIRSDLGRYLPSELVDRVVAREQDMGLGGRRMPITVLFADVVAFTPMTEQLAPEQVVSLLNELFTLMTEVVFRHGGTVDKFVGDCVMAIWGAPRPEPEHAAQALAAAEDMMRWLEIGNEGWSKTYGTTIQLAIGLNTGECIVGNIGSESRMEYTAIGDAVNVAARLEAIARPQQIVVSETTRAAAGDDFEYIDLGTHPIAGKGTGMQLFEVRP
ncbi:MAG: adenylate/guanylate cyclase domain-containing protein [Bradymonadia bacterium]